MISLSSNYRVLRSNVHRTMFAPQCFQMISILLDFDTKVEMVKFEKNPRLHSPRFLDILGQNLKIDIICKPSSH